MLGLIEKFIHIENSSEEIAKTQNVLFNTFQAYEELMMNKTKIYKDSYLALIALSQHTQKIDAMATIFTNMMNELKRSVNQISIGKEVTMARPSFFELECSRVMLSETKNLF